RHAHGEESGAARGPGPRVNGTAGGRPQTEGPDERGGDYGEHRSRGRTAHRDSPSARRGRVNRAAANPRFPRGTRPGASNGLQPLRLPLRTTTCNDRKVIGALHHRGRRWRKALSSWVSLRGGSRGQGQGYRRAAKELTEEDRTILAHRWHRQPDGRCLGSGELRGGADRGQRRRAASSW